MMLACRRCWCCTAGSGAGVLIVMVHPEKVMVEVFVVEIQQDRQRKLGGFRKIGCSADISMFSILWVKLAVIDLQPTSIEYHVIISWTSFSCLLKIYIHRRPQPKGTKHRQQQELN